MEESTQKSPFGYPPHYKKKIIHVPKEPKIGTPVQFARLDTTRHNYRSVVEQGASSRASAGAAGPGRSELTVQAFFGQTRRVCPTDNIN